MSPIPPTRSPLDAGAISPEDIEIALKPARDRFCSLLLDRILALEGFRKLLAGDDNPGPALAGIADIAHKISGVGATLGFAQAGELADVVDQSLSELRKKPARYGEMKSSLDQQLEALLIELESLIDRQPTDPDQV